jgi:hypothetical protein
MGSRHRPATGAIPAPQPRVLAIPKLSTVDSPPPIHGAFDSRMWNPHPYRHLYG